MMVWGSGNQGCLCPVTPTSPPVRQPLQPPQLHGAGWVPGPLQCWCHSLLELLRWHWKTAWLLFSGVFCLSFFFFFFLECGFSWPKAPAESHCQLQASLVIMSPLSGTVGFEAHGAGTAAPCSPRVCMAGTWPSLQSGLPDPGVLQGTSPSPKA